MVVHSAEPLLLGSQLATYLASHEFKKEVEEHQLEQRIKNRRSKQTA